MLFFAFRKLFKKHHKKHHNLSIKKKNLKKCNLMISFLFIYYKKLLEILNSSG